MKLNLCQLKSTAIAAVAPLPVDGVISCIEDIFTDVGICNIKVAGMEICDVKGPEFDARLCYREMITCYVDGLLQVGECLDVDEIKLDKMTPKADGFLVCFYNMAIQIEACAAKGVYHMQYQDQNGL